MTTHQETQQLITSALARMTEAERNKILLMADTLVQGVKLRSPLVQFSKANALEVLLKWGLNMATERISVRERIRVENYMRTA